METDEQVQAFLKSPVASGFILDFDGTLAPIVPDPETAAIAPRAPKVLEALCGNYESVAVVSGRRAEDVAERVGVRGLRYVGLHGGEELAGGKLQLPAEAPSYQQEAVRLAGAAERLLEEERLAGCRVEQKGMAVSVHFRNAESPAAAGIVLGWAQEVGVAGGFKVGVGRKVVELRPVEFSKASAVERLVDEHRLRNLLVAGDDLTDMEAMRRAGELQLDVLFRVGVTSDEAPAGLAQETEFLVGSPEELIDVLKRFIAP